jgi:hypothetical protein
MKSPMHTAIRILRQPGKRRQGWVGRGDVQYGQTKRKGALICFIFGRYTANQDYFWTGIFLKLIL